MPSQRIVHGITYTIPQENDEGWGANTTTILEDLLENDAHLFNVWNFGATGAGSVDESSYINSAFTAATAETNGGDVYFPAGTYKIGATVTVPADCRAIFAKGAKLQWLTSGKFTCNGEFFAPLSSQVFSGFSAGDITFAAGSVERFFPGWWGAAGDGATDDAAAIQGALDAAATNGGIVFLPTGTYKVDSTITIAANVSLRYSNGATISKGTSGLVVFNGDILAVAVSLFTGFSAGDITFNKIPTIYHPAWEGGSADARMTVSRLSSDFQSVTAVTSTTIDWANGYNVKLAMNTNITTLTLNNPREGERYFLILTQDATGSRTISWPAAVKWPGGTAPTLGGANVIDVVALMYDGTNYLGEFANSYS